MPKLFVPKDYVDEEFAKLRREIAELKSEVAGLRQQAATGIQGTVFYDASLGVTIADEPEEDQNNVGKNAMVTEPKQGCNNVSEAANDQEGDETADNASSSDISFGVKLEDGGKKTEASDKSEQEEEMICFDKKSAWCIPLVLSRRHGGEALFAFLLLLLTGAMQVLFAIIVASPEFLGPDFLENLESARTWRSSTAHDVQYVDLAEKSLATKVCDEDGSLIFSTAQAELVGNINSYLGLEKLGGLAFEPPTFQPGVLLSVLCILLWNICVFKEFRSVWYIMRAILLGSRPASTSAPSTWKGLSCQRALLMQLVCLGRVAVASALLVTGSIWLGRTIEITELMLNSVALESVLHVDEFIFSALVPTSVQQKVQALPPVRIKKSRRWPHMENSILALLLISALLCPYFLLLHPLREGMVSVKRELCDGNLEFIVGVKDSQLFKVQTNPSGTEVAETYIERGAKEAAFPARFPDTVTEATLISDSAAMREYLTTSYSERKKELVACNEHGAGSNYGELIAGIAYHFGLPGATTCAELAHLCSEQAPLEVFTSSQVVYLRFVCGRTCGCTDPLSTPMLKQPDWGCPRACIMESYRFSADPRSDLYGQPPNFTAGCKDMAPGPGWLHFFGQENYNVFWGWHFSSNTIRNLPELYQFSALAREQGCAALNHWSIDLGGSPLCRGGPRYASLAWLCPETCGCASSGNAERDHFCFAHDFCPFHVPPGETDAALTFIRKYDFTKTLINPELIHFDE